MENEKRVEGFYVFEWSIDNFSCWNKEIHVNVIPSPKSCNFDGLSLELYPRGFSGDKEHLMVHINGGGIWNLSGELSYIGPDGSLLYRQQVDSEEKNVLKLPSGPKFETVVAQIKKKEALYEDRLTVRYLKRYHRNYTEYMHTVINAYDVSFKMSRETLDNLHSKKETHFFISNFQGNENEVLQLSAFKDKIDSSIIMMELHPLNFVKKVLVLASMSVLNIDDELVKTVECEHAFLDRNGWPFSITLAKEHMKDLKESPTSLILSLKIIPSINYRHSLSLLQFPESQVDILPSNSFISYSKSISANKSLKSVTSNQKDESAAILAKQLMCLYKDQDFSDFQLKCGDVSIPVHKNILSARSPVFKTMLSTAMREATSGCMDIVDLDPSTLCLFLAFLYTGSVEELQCEAALKLYYAADKYQVPSLKTKCADFLRDNVSISNVCEILSLANKHHDHQLIALVHEFILNNYNDVLSSEEWKSFMRSEPLLAVETLTNFAEKRYVRKRKSFLRKFTS